MPHSVPDERGLTFLSFLVVASVAGFLLMLVLKIGPIYLDHYKVVASLQSLKADPSFPSKTRDEILRGLEKRWDIDMIDSVTRDDVVITKDYQRIKVQVKYDAKKPIMGNVSALVHFDDAIEVGAN